MRSVVFVMTTAWRTWCPYHRKEPLSFSFNRESRPHGDRSFDEACGGADGNLGAFVRTALAETKTACGADAACVGFSFGAATGRGGGGSGSGGGYYKSNAACGFVTSAAYDG